MLCTYNQGCFGCCGTEFCKDKQQVIDTIETNTKELKQYKDLNKFRDRKGPLYPLNEKGVKGLCPNVTKLKNNTYGCILHPKQNKKDYRNNYCYEEYLCPTQKQYNKWNKALKAKFIKYLNKLALDPYDYSIQMDNNQLLKNYINNNK